MSREIVSFSKGAPFHGANDKAWCYFLHLLSHVTSLYWNLCSLPQLSWSVPTEGQICCIINARIETMRVSRYFSHEIVNFYVNEESRTLDIAVFKAQTTCRIHNCLICLFFIIGTALHQLNTLYSFKKSGLVWLMKRLGGPCRFAGYCLNICSEKWGNVQRKLRIFHLQGKICAEDTQNMEF
jgi:hypothetical protein